MGYSIPTACTTLKGRIETVTKEFIIFSHEAKKFKSVTHNKKSEDEPQQFTPHARFPHKY